MTPIRSILTISPLLLAFACGSESVDISVDAGQGIVDAGSQEGDGATDAMEVTGCGPNNTVCTGETICVEEACEAAFDRTYEFHLLLAKLELTDSKGMSWDLSGGAPDPYMVLEINGVEVMRTEPVEDSFVPEFPETTLQVIPAGATITATLYDSDIGPDDKVFVCEATPITAENLREGVLSCDGGGSLLDPPSLLLGISLN